VEISDRDLLYSLAEPERFHRRLLQQDVGALWRLTAYGLNVVGNANDLIIIIPRLFRYVNDLFSSRLFPKFESDVDTGEAANSCKNNPR
jgi:hypothetical protein